LPLFGLLLCCFFFSSFVGTAVTPSPSPSASTIPPPVPNHTGCTVFEYSTPSEFQCIYPNNTFYLPNGLPVNTTQFQAGAGSVDVCFDHFVNTQQCTTSLPGTLPPPTANKRENEENDDIDSTDGKKLPRFLKGLKKTKQRLRYLPGYLRTSDNNNIQEYLRGVVNPCYSTMSLQWMACNNSGRVAAFSPNVASGNLCQDFSLPELAKYPTNPVFENITCSSTGCLCIDVPTAAQFGLPNFNGVSIGLIVTYHENIANPFIGISLNSQCQNGTCLVTTTTTTGGNANSTGGSTTGLVGATVSAVTGATSSSSDDLALILGLALGLGIPCLICCIILIIAAIAGLILLLLKGKGATVKTFWVPSRDDL